VRRIASVGEPFRIEGIAMRNSLFAVSALALFAVPAFSQKLTVNDKLPGEVWTWEATKGELSRKGEFRIHDKKVFIVERNVGTVSVKRDEATLVVRANPTLNGRIVLKRDGAGWRGVIEHGKGSKWNIVVRVKEVAPPKKDPKPKKQK
jgi:hypothetical protein